MCACIETSDLEALRKEFTLQGRTMFTSSALKSHMICNKSYFKVDLRNYLIARFFVGNINIFVIICSLQMLLLVDFESVVRSGKKCTRFAFKSKLKYFFLD